mmetsp:Transcript_96082/g.184603  ORF Transcript_96082/g.184603 Transcript_96082/m.184603 type:complete len:227 (+) Transcript_96082:434-1114(+)
MAIGMQQSKVVLCMSISSLCRLLIPMQSLAVVPGQSTYALRKANTQVALSSSMASQSCLLEPFHRLMKFSWQPLTGKVVRAQIILRSSISQPRSALAPSQRSVSVILNTAASVDMRNAQQIHGVSIILLCRLLYPFHRLNLILACALSPHEHLCQISLGSPMTLKCSLVPPVHGLSRIPLQAAKAFSVQGSQAILRVRVPMLCSAPVPRNCGSQVGHLGLHIKAFF